MKILLCGGSHGLNVYLPYLGDGEKESFPSRPKLKPRQSFQFYGENGQRYNRANSSDSGPKGFSRFIPYELRIHSSSQQHWYGPKNRLGALSSLSGSKPTRGSLQRRFYSFVLRIRSAEFYRHFTFHVEVSRDEKLPACCFYQNLQSHGLPHPKRNFIQKQRPGRHHAPA